MIGKSRRGARLAVAAAVAALCASCAMPAPAPAPEGAVPILFVHGHGGTSDAFADMIEHLERRGYPPGYLLAVDLVPNDGANVAAAREVLAPAVEDLLARTGGGSEVDIVAHSMGALSGRWYATQLRPDRVRTLVTVGGANHGTDDLCGYPDPAGTELCPAFAAADNPVQIGLNGTPDAPVDETPYGRGADRPAAAAVPADAGRDIRYVAVVIAGDEWIEPLASSELDGADLVTALPPDLAVEQIRPGNLVLGEPTGHDAVLHDGRFFVLLDAILDQGTGR